MDATFFLTKWSLLIILLCFQEKTLACQQQVCRRRRQISDEIVKVTDGTVKLELRGCTGRSPTWVRQIAYCLNLSTIEMALTIKDWYASTYEKCSKQGCSNYVSGNKDNDAIKNCIACWKGSVRESEVIRDFNLTAQEVDPCIEKYIYAFLNKDLPILNPETRLKSHIDLADIRPAEYWWSVRVELPCKPKLFKYWNAYCINSFARDLKEGDYVLVQNNLIEDKSGRITFFVQFSNTCTFEPEEVRIIWDESTPAQSLVQSSAYPSQFPPAAEENFSVYFDVDAAKRLIDTDGGVPKEFRRARWQAKKSARGKRQIEEKTALARIGVLFPCSVRSFRTTDIDVKLPYRIYGYGDRFLIDTDTILGQENGTKIMNFALDYGFDETRCFFDSGDTKLVPNPPSNWLKTSKARHIMTEKKASSGISCATCVNMRSDKDCLDRGVVTPCAPGEGCQTEVRQITRDLKLITKACKQRIACQAESMGNASPQCRPKEPGSVCRCCCSSNMCNAGNQHHTGDFFICKNSFM
uniref:uncharacterized protein LOC120339683 isoform X1 n=1 Tax=Styela clava TaxID=7725 RepID=UPI0019396211|nr:uncharacterized protein LOC120339683 isoform X1 [Styela clava]